MTDLKLRIFKVCADSEATPPPPHPTPVWIGLSNNGISYGHMTRQVKIFPKIAKF